MRLPSHLPTTVASLFLILPSLTAALGINCKEVRDDGVHWNLDPLNGPHNVYIVKEHTNTITNTTITINICTFLDKSKGVPKDEDCPNGTKVCAIERLTNVVENKTTIAATIPIAGEYGHTIGGNLNPKWTRLKSSESSADREREGVRLQIGGGEYEDQEQKAIVEFLCPAKNGEQNLTAENEEDHKYGSAVDDGHDGTIEILSWEDEKDVKVLRLQWKTQYACEDVKDEDSSSNGSWGFFTWFILIVFMGVAAYLIFGSWLNYNRYSARGWDLVPHSETIRDIPYIFRDWVRSVVNTVQGGGSRGGYSAV